MKSMLPNSLNENNSSSEEDELYSVEEKEFIRLHYGETALSDISSDEDMSEVFNNYDGIDLCFYGARENKIKKLIKKYYESNMKKAVDINPEEFMCDPMKYGTIVDSENNKVDINKVYQFLLNHEECISLYKNIDIIARMLR